MAATRFTATLGAEGQALGDLADRVNQVSERAYLSRATTTALTAAQLINGVLVQTGTNGAMNLTLPSSASIIAALGACQVGSMFEFVLLNTNNGTATVVAGDAGTTLVGTTACPTNKSQIYYGIVTNATAGAEALNFVGVLYAPS